MGSVDGTSALGAIPTKAAAAQAKALSATCSARIDSVRWLHSSARASGMLCEGAGIKCYSRFRRLLRRMRRCSGLLRGELRYGCGGRGECSEGGEEDRFEAEADNVYRNEFLNSKTGRALYAEEAE
jgi:hypothetical protein